MKFTRFVNIRHAPQRKPPTSIGYKMWNEESNKWDNYNSIGELVESKKDK